MNLANPASSANLPTARRGDDPLKVARCIYMAYMIQRCLNAGVRRKEIRFLLDVSEQTYSDYRNRRKAPDLADLPGIHAIFAELLGEEVAPLYVHVFLANVEYSCGGYSGVQFWIEPGKSRREAPGSAAMLALVNAAIAIDPRLVHIGPSESGCNIGAAKLTASVIPAKRRKLERLAKVLSTLRASG